MAATKKVLVLAAVSEAATGAALLIVPAVVGRLLLGADLTGISIPIARVAGIALIALGMACWPGSAMTQTQALGGMLTYIAPVMLYLAYLGIEGEWVGHLLWPAVVAHAILTFLLARAWLKDRHDYTK